MPETVPTSAEAATTDRLPFYGYVDEISRTSISGWAFDTAEPTARIALVISANDQVIGRIVADQHRPDLEKSGFGDGCCGFGFVPSGILAADTRYTIEVRRESDSVQLQGSPVVLEPTESAIAMLGELKGNLDSVSRQHLTGWAVNAGDHDLHVGLVVSIDGRVIARVLANQFREDLQKAGFGDGHHGFNLTLPEQSPLSQHEVHVRREADGAELSGSPKILPPLTSFDSEMEQEIAGLLARIESAADESRALDFLVRQTDLLLSRRADREANRAARTAQNLFRRRWGKNPEEAEGAATPGGALATPRALVIDDHVPDGARDAGSTAILSHMRALKAFGYEVGFVAACAMDDGPAMAALERDERITAFAAPFYCSVEDLLKRQEACFDLIYLHRLSNARKYLSLARAYQPRARIVYSVADLHHLRLARQAEIEQRPELLIFSNQVAFGEFSSAHQADSVITHSPFEAQLLGEKVPARKVHVVPWVVLPRPCTTPFANRHGLAVIGHFAHPPNPDSVYWLIQQVMPLVWETDPTIRCLIVGHGWTDDRLPRRDERIEVIGAVPDLRDIFSRVRLTVAPLRFGAGIKGKVLESLAAGIPCVMSPVAAEGLRLPQPLDELVADGADATAQAILRLHGDATSNRAASAAGLAMIAEQVSEQRVVEAMAKALALPR